MEQLEAATEVFCKNRRPKSFRKIHKKTPVLESLC